MPVRASFSNEIEPVRQRGEASSPRSVRESALDRPAVPAGRLPNASTGGRDRPAPESPDGVTQARSGRCRLVQSIGRPWPRQSTVRPRIR
jgi:hypothetical protein